MEAIRYCISRGLKPWVLKLCVSVMSSKTRFVLVGLLQIVGKMIDLMSKAKELANPFNLPCEVVEVYLATKIIAQQYNLKYNALVLCIDGEVYGSNSFDIGSKEYAEPVRYILVNAFNIRGHDAFKLSLVLRRSSGVAVLKQGGIVKVLYSI